MIGVGLVGFGFAGSTFHAPVISAVSGLRLVAILQRVSSDASKKYPEAQIVRTMEELLALDCVRLVVIATPNTTHFDLAKRCLLAGRDVVIDKPFTTTYREAAELVDLARSTGRLLSVYQNRRWDGDFLTLQLLLNTGRLGRLVLFDSHFDRFRPHLRAHAWREQAGPGSGVLFDLGPHLIDQALQLFGKPEGLIADVRAERDDAVVDDAFDIVLHYPRMRAILRASMLASAQTPRLIVQGTRGGYLKYGLDPQEDALKRGETPQRELWGMEGSERWGTLMTLVGDNFTSESYPTAAGDYRGYYGNVRDAIEGKSPLAVTPEHALRVMAALEFARESSEKKCFVPWREKP